MAEKNKKVFDLRSFFGEGKDFTVNNKKYRVYPLTIAHAQEFLRSEIDINLPILNFATDERMNVIARWMGEVSVQLGGDVYKARFITYDDGAEMSFEQAIKDGWSVEDLKKFFKILVEISD